MAMNSDHLRNAGFGGCCFALFQEKGGYRSKFSVIKVHTRAKSGEAVDLFLFLGS